MSGLKVLVSVCLLLQLVRANGSSADSHFKRSGPLSSIHRLKDTSTGEQATRLQGGPWVSISRRPGPAERPDRDAFPLTGSAKDREDVGPLVGELKGSDWSGLWLSDSRNDREKRIIFGKLTWHREKPRGFPGYAIGRLGNGCTVFFIGPFQALTAAHCVYNRKKHQWAEWALDIASLAECNDPYFAHGHTKEWVSVHVSQRYIEAGLWADDIALIVTCNSVCLVNPCLGLQLAEYPTDFGSQRLANITIYGYPLHLRNAVKHPSHFFPLYCLVSSSCSNARCNRYLRDLLEYRCDTAQGMSGGPIIAQDLSNDTKEYYVYGLHSFGIAGYRNFGVKFTSSKIDEIQSLVCNITAMSYPPFCHSDGCGSSSDTHDSNVDTEQMNCTNVTKVTIATIVPTIATIAPTIATTAPTTAETVPTTTSPFISVTRSKN